MPIELAVTGSVPTSLSGQYVRVSEGEVHAVRLAQGRAPSYRNRSIRTGATDVVAFGSSMLVFGDGQPAHELGAGLDAVRRVDLAGADRALTAHPKVDTTTGELHLLTFTIDPSQLHIRVSPGGLTRTVRSIDSAPNRIGQLELTRDHVVLLADGFVGLLDRAGLSPKTSWFPIDTDARHIAAAYDRGESVVVYATGPSLARWTLHRRSTTAHSQVLDATPHTFASSNSGPMGATRRFLWTVGSGAVHKHDLLTGTRQSHRFSGGRHAGEHVFVADVERAGTEDGGWLVGLVHDDTKHETDFVVLDAHAIERPAIAVAHIPHHIPNGARGTWIPSVQISGDAEGAGAPPTVLTDQP